MLAGVAALVGYFPAMVLGLAGAAICLIVADHIVKRHLVSHIAMGGRRIVAENRKLIDPLATLSEELRADQLASMRALQGISNRMSDSLLNTRLLKKRLADVTSSLSSLDGLVRRKQEQDKQGQSVVLEELQGLNGRFRETSRSLDKATSTVSELPHELRSMRSSTQGIVTRALADFGRAYTRQAKLDRLEQSEQREVVVNEIKRSSATTQANIVHEMVESLTGVFKDYEGLATRMEHEFQGAKYGLLRANIETRREMLASTTDGLALISDDVSVLKDLLEHKIGEQKQQGQEASKLIGEASKMLSELERTTAGAAERMESKAALLAQRSFEVCNQTTSDVSDVLQDIKEGARTTGERMSKMETRFLKEIEALEDAEERHSRAWKYYLQRLQVQLDRNVGATADLIRLSADMLPESAIVPPLGGWALKPTTLTALLSEISRDDHCDTIVECGSGASTVWMGLMCKHRGQGHVFALENDPKYAALSRDYIRDNDLDDWVTVIDAPLEKVTVEGEERTWYAESAWASLDRIDLLLVDGPPGTVEEQIRYSALPLLMSRLNDQALIVLDDTDRSEEKHIMDKWQGLQKTRSLNMLKELPESTFARLGPRNDD